MDDRDRRQESDLGYEQRLRVRVGGEAVRTDTPTSAPALDSQATAQRAGLADDSDGSVATGPETADPELQEDLRRAQPNPPMTEPALADPMSDVDLGYLEDQEREAAWDLDTLERPVAAEPTDPLEEERERGDRPGPSTGQLPDQVGNRPPGERDRR